MIVTHKINMDLARRGPMPCIEVTQGDKYSRELEIRLRMNGDAFVLPEGCRVMVNYSKTIGKDEVGGVYDTMPDGSDAWRIDGDTVTVGLAPQLCAAAGEVKLTVTLLHGGAELGCFAICLEVLGKPGDKGRRESYVNVNGFLPQPGGAQVGQYLEIEEVDAFGRVVKLKSVEVPAGGSGDWSAAEGKPGHVLNRTHWVETVNIDPSFDGNLTERVVLPLSEGMNLVKITDHVLSEKDCIGAEITIVFPEGTETGMIPANGVVDATATFGISCFIADISGEGIPFVAVVREAGTVQGLEVSAGTYYLSLVEDGAQMYVSYFSALGNLEFIHKLDNKFIDAEWIATTKISKDAVIWEEIERTTNASTSDGVAYVTGETLPLQNGISYLVTLNNVDYQCVCQEYLSGTIETLVLGNLGLVTDSSGTAFGTNSGEPFLLMIMLHEGITHVAFADPQTTTFTMGIYEVVEVPTKLPEKFLPEGYSRDELVEAVIAALPGAEEVAF